MMTKKQTEVDESIETPTEAVETPESPGLEAAIKQAVAQGDALTKLADKVGAARAAYEEAQDEALAAWNAIFDELVALEVRYGDLPMFGKSKLGRILEIARQQRMYERPSGN